MRRALVFGLRARNIDVLTAWDARMVDRGDEDHLAFAANSERVFTPSMPATIDPPALDR